MMKFIVTLLLLATVSIEYSVGYSAFQDAKIIAEFKMEQEKNHAKVARTLVHQANWAAVGTISTNPTIPGYPMVNIIAVDDSGVDGKSTGKIHFLLTDLDFTGPDWKHENKVTMLFSDDQNLNCKKRGVDPMEPTCPRTIISGKVTEMKKENPKYADIVKAFIARHPAAINWIHVHSFYMCEMDIENVFVLDFYGGPHTVKVEDYYKAEGDNEVLQF